MKKILLFTPFIIFFIFLIIFFKLLINNRDPSEIPSALINKKIPMFTSSSLFEEYDFISSREFGEQITLVNFFASWCNPCRIEHKFLKRLSNNKKVKIIGINYKDNSQKAIKWLNELGNPYNKIAIDSNGQIAINWGVYGIPETFIVNDNNTILYRLAGPITHKKYDELNSIIKKNSQSK